MMTFIRNLIDGADEREPLTLMPAADRRSLTERHSERVNLELTELYTDKLVTEERIQELQNHVNDLNIAIRAYEAAAERFNQDAGSVAPALGEAPRDDGPESGLVPGDAPLHEDEGKNVGGEDTRGAYPPPPSEGVSDQSTEGEGLSSYEVAVLRHLNGEETAIRTYGTAYNQAQGLLFARGYIGVSGSATKKGKEYLEEINNGR